MQQETHLYRQIAESLRQEILRGDLTPGDRVPGIREMTVRWGCTPGTVQKAYQELTHQGLIVSRPGQGTHVAASPARRAEAPLRWASLVHKAESFLLEVLTTGYTPAEAERAFLSALDHWRTLNAQPVAAPGPCLRFVGSHDPALALVATLLPDIAPGHGLDVVFAGSLGGLMALAKGEADLAGSHLWDQETDTYNAQFVRRLLPGRRVALVTLAYRRLGLVVSPGHPLRLVGLEDLARPGVRFVNRQPGSGTRVWLDAQLGRRGVAAGGIQGYRDELSTHGEVAMTVAEGRADVGLAIEAAARAYGLDFLLLTRERYDLVVPAECWSSEEMAALREWLLGEEARAAISELGGYDVEATGQVEWVE